MLPPIKKILTEKNIRSHPNEGILVANVANNREGLGLAKEILSTVVDKKTALYLSGGRTPKELYETFATEPARSAVADATAGGERLHPGSVGLVDERYGEKMHENSNEKMLKDAGLLRFLDYNDIPFYSVLHIHYSHPELVSGSSSSLRAQAPASPSESEVGKQSHEMLKRVQHDNERELAAQAYDEKLRSLLSVFQKQIAVLGIGLDGHTAGIAGNRPDFTNPLFDPSRKSLLVSEFNDELGMFKERITMTFLGLSHMDFLLVLVFGEDKQKALELMFQNGPEEDIPSRFLKRPDIAPKTLLITDQNV